jgi:hypothetical protein
VPRYFFNVKDGKDLPDHDGTELASIAEARNQAIVSAGEMIRADRETVWNGSDWRMDVTDEVGDRLFTLRFSADDYGPQNYRWKGFPTENGLLRVSWLTAAGRHFRDRWALLRRLVPT